MENTLKLEKTDFEKIYPSIEDSKENFIGLLDDFMEPVQRRVCNLSESVGSGYFLTLEDPRQSLLTYSQTSIHYPPGPGQQSLILPREPLKNPFPWLLMGFISKYNEDGSCIPQVGDYIEALRVKILPVGERIRVEITTKYKCVEVDFLPDLLGLIKESYPDSNQIQAWQASPTKEQTFDPDPTDNRILAILKIKGINITDMQIGQEIGICRQNVNKRRKALEKAGYIVR